MNELSLFSGAGGGLLGTKLLGFNHIGYVEYNDYCQRVLAQRIKDGILDNAPIYSDIRAFIDSGRCELYRGVTDIITAGFPCQPFSTAASGNHDKSKDMWPECFHVIKTVKPRSCLLENTSRKAIDRARINLESTGYSCKSATISAASMGAAFIGRREWLFAEADNKSKSSSGFYDEVEVIKAIKRFTWWDENTPAIMGVDDGLPQRVERFKSIGNAQIPAMAATAYRLLSIVAID